MSMSGKQTVLICGFALCVAAILFAISQQWIIFRLPQVHTQSTEEHVITKQQVTLWFLHQNQWKNEKTELLWSQNISENISQLVSALLMLFEEEQFLAKKTTVQSVTLTADHMTALISFDRPPLEKQASVYAKWMMIEAILKTIRTNGIKIQSVQFLTHHQPMQDAHLDFMRPWPVNGFQE